MPAEEAYPKGRCGRRGLPKELVDKMFAQYQSGLSLEDVGHLHGRTRQSIYDLFHGRGLKMREKEFHKPVKHRGRKYTPGKNGYLRDTIFRRGRKTGEVQLHRVIWEEKHGPIPDGFNVMFRDGNKRNVKLSNLFCAPIAAVSSQTATGENQFTKSARDRMGILLGNFRRGDKSLSAGLKR